VCYNQSFLLHSWTFCRVSRTLLQGESYPVLHPSGA